jgi:hypothetical protein
MTFHHCSAERKKVLPKMRNSQELRCKVAKTPRGKEGFLYFRPLAGPPVREAGRGLFAAPLGQRLRRAGWPLFPFPVSHFREQARERHRHAILPRFDGNTSNILIFIGGGRNGTTGFRISRRQALARQVARIRHGWKGEP